MRPIIWNKLTGPSFVVLLLLSCYLQLGVFRIIMVDCATHYLQWPLSTSSSPLSHEYIITPTSLQKRGKYKRKGWLCHRSKKMNANELHIVFIVISSQNSKVSLVNKVETYLNSYRLEICRNRRSCRFFVNCVNFSRKQRSFLHILQVYTHLSS